MHVYRLHAGDGVADHVDEACLRNDLCHPLGDAAVDVGPRIAQRALSDCSGPVGAVEERLVPATAAGPVVLSYEEVRLAEHPAASNEDVAGISAGSAHLRYGCLAPVDSTSRAYPAVQGRPW